MKVETHNHPTAISPSRAATGAGGEIRDEGATGRGSRPEGGPDRLSVSNLHLPGTSEPWERDPCGKPEHIASALQIMIDGPIGGAAFNNEFGRPTWAATSASTSRRWPACARLPQADHDRRRPGHDLRHADEQDQFPAGTLLVQLGGPGMRIGMGGGAASSMAAGANARRAGLRLGAARQPGDPAPRAGGHQPLLGAGEANPILAIHDVGAGGCQQRRSRNWWTAPGVARVSICARCRWRRAAWRRRRSGATRARSVT